MNAWTVLLTLATTFCSVNGALQFREYTQSLALKPLITGFSLYLLSNIFWIMLLRSQSLGWAAAIVSIVGTSTLVIIDGVSSGAMPRDRLIGLLFAVLAVYFFSTTEAA